MSDPFNENDDHEEYEDDDEDSEKEDTITIDGCVSCGTNWLEDTGPVICHECLTNSVMIILEEQKKNVD